MQGEIAQILVVPSGIITVPQSGVPDIVTLVHEYEQNASALVPIGDSLSLMDIFSNVGPTHLHLVVRTGVAECLYIFRLDTKELDILRRTASTTPIPTAMPADKSRGSMIYKPLNRIPLKPANTLKDRVALTDRSSWEEVSIFDALEDAYPLGCSRDIIHLVVDRPASTLIASIESEEIITPSYSMIGVRNLYFAQNATKAPSTRGQLTSVMETQSNNRSASFCGRPLNREAVVSASQYDENLAIFRQNLDTIIPTPSDVETFYLLRSALTDFFSNEAQRCSKLTDVLTKGVIPAESVLQRGSVSNYSTDGDLRVDTVAGRCIYFVLEVKNEVGQGGAIPEFEAPHYWIEQM